MKKKSYGGILLNYNGKGGKNTDIRMGFLKNLVVLRHEK